VQRISSIEMVIIFIILSVIIMIATPPFTYLIISWVAAICSLIMLLFTNKKLFNFKKCLFIISFLLACYLTGISEINPLNARLKGGQFNDVSVAEILQHFAKQKTNWSFVLVGEQLSTKRASVFIPDGITFEQVLNTISNSTDSDYCWYRHSFCGNDPGARSIRFELTQKCGDKDKRLYVFRSEIIDSQKN
jgi:hypothetical protein